MGESLTMIDSQDRPPLYEPLEMSMDKEDMLEIMQLYLEFLSLPEEVKQTFNLDKEGNRTSEAGYMKRKKAESTKPTGDDNKMVFHHTTELWDYFQSLSPQDIPQAAREFIGAANYLYHQTSDASKQKIAEWCQDQPWIAGSMFPDDNTLNHHLRFLAYFDGGARGHYDKSVFTAPLFQSKPGLRVGEGPDDLTLVQKDHFDPIIFASLGWMQLHELLDQQTDRIPVWHDAPEIDCEESDDLTPEILQNAAERANGPNLDEVMDVARLAVVMFGNPAKIYLDSTLEQTHTPIHWRNIGRIAMPIDSKHSFLAA